MKRYFTLLILFSGMVMLGCKKENVEKSIVGTWELRNVAGGQLPVDPSVIAPGSGSLITFSDDGYERRVKGTVVSSGSYSLRKESANVNGDNADYRIVFDDQSSAIKSYISLSGNTLKIHYGEIALDGIQETYKRIEVSTQN
ncbi:MAG TPA: hypothetical protein VGE15_05100 [Sphingobacteriaceae bacterium]